MLSQNKIRKIAMDSDSDERNITHLKTRRTKMIHVHLRNGLPCHILQAQIFLPAALKMTMMLVRAAQHGSGKKALFPSVGPGYSQQLHPFIFMWCDENLTHILSAHPFQRDADTVWAWATTNHACRETSPIF
jgi:hypothetical protein